MLISADQHRSMINDILPELIEWEGNGYPVTFNDAAKVEQFFEIAKAAVGTNNAPIWPNPVMGGEDFAFYCREVPACFFLLG